MSASGMLPRSYSALKRTIFAEPVRRALRRLIAAIACLVILHSIFVKPHFSRVPSPSSGTSNSRHNALRSTENDTDRFVSEVCKYLGSATLCNSPSSHTTPRDAVLSVQYVETRFNGLGSQFLRMVDAATVADALQTPFEVVSRRYWNYGCAPYRGWACYFNRTQALERNCVELADWRPTNYGSCVRVSTPPSLQLAAMVHRRASGGHVPVARRMARMLWKLNSRTSRDVSLLLALADVRALRGRYVGVHVRRGDKRREVEEVQLARYARAIRCLVRDDDLMPVFVASDDGAAVDELRILLTPRKVLALPHVERRTGHYQRDVNRRYMRRNRAAVTELLAEITALSQATWFIATFSSNLARMVHVLRDAPAHTSVSLDDRWAPGVAWRTFGKLYCSSSEANADFCKCFSLEADI